MHDFDYDEAGQLCCAEVPLEKIAREIGTPYYCYSLPTLRRHIQAFEEPLKGIDHQTCFAMKANSNLAILTLMAHHGLGADVVSGGELFRALKAGIPASKIVYSGVGKTTAEIDMAIQAGIMMFNIESEQELEVINERAGALRKKAPISIRVNPDVDPQTHPYISTGMKQNKFGIDIEGTLKQYLRAKDMEHLEIVGIACHIGSQLTDISPFIDAIERLKVLMANIKDLGIEFKYLDLGRGPGHHLFIRASASPQGIWRCHHRCGQGSEHQADLRAGQGHCGECRCDGDPGALPQGGPQEDIHHRGCGHE